VAVSLIKPKYKKGTHYVITEWGQAPKTIPNYECVDCQFKTTQADKMNEHLDAAAANLEAHRIPWPDVDDDGNKLGGKHPSLLESAKKG